MSKRRVGSRENAFSRRSGANREINSIRSLSATALSRRRSATDSIGSSSNRSSRHPTTLLGQEAHRNSTLVNANGCSNSFKSHRSNVATTGKHGRRSYFSTTSKKNTALSTAKATRTRCCTRPGCPGGQRGLAITKPILRTKPSFRRQSKKTAGTDRENRRCRRSVHQARRHSTTTWLVPNRVESDDRDLELLGQGDSAWRCHRRR